MSKNLQIKTAIIVVTILACIYGIIGLPKSKAELVQNFQKNIRLGLDLRGGSHLVLQVQTQDAFKAEADGIIERLGQDLKKANVEYAAITRNEPSTLADADKIEIDIKGVPIGKVTQARDIINDKVGASWNVSNVNSTDFKLSIKPTAASELRRDTVARSLTTIENRINQLGLTEPSVQPRGRSDAESEILVQLPGVDDPGRIKQIIGATALLEIDEVKGGPFESKEAILAQNGGILPPNTKPVQSNRNGGWYLLNRIPVVTGRDLRNARPGRDQTGRFQTEFSLGPDGAQRFEAFTGANIGKPLAIVLDGKAYSVANIESKISDSGVITGQATQQESSDLALVLRAGALPAGVQYLEERTVGPSLGADSVRAGLLAGVAGLIAVVAAMLIYYKKSGINATLALILNAIILIAALSYFEATLTLPGIAGIILTIGMAVDSNVLIFERIREELRAGKSVPAAVDAGFSKAFLTILDTHVTTVVSCAFLFIFGNGPVKGFAVTLVIGLIANVFTAVFVSKVIFDYELSGRKPVTQLSI